MTTEEIINHFGFVKEECNLVFFEPSEVFNKGIIGITEDKEHLIYGYEKLAIALSEEYEKEWNESKHSADEEKPDFYFDACEWIDYNTIRKIPYIKNEYGYEPIIIYELMED